MKFVRNEVLMKFQKDDDARAFKKYNTFLNPSKFQANM